MVPIIRQIRDANYLIYRAYAQSRACDSRWEIFDMVRRFVNDNFCKIDTIRGFKIGGFNQVAIAESDGKIFVIKTLLFQSVQKFFMLSRA